VAKQAAEEKTRIDVVQIGGRAPEPVPDIDKDGKSLGFRKDEFGKTLTTELSTEGEAQLAEIAKTTGGAIVRAEKGDTGIDEIARALKKMMREELAERVEIAFDEEYMWPLGFAVLLLAIEGLIPEAPLPRLSFGGVPNVALLPQRPAAKTKKKKEGGAPKKKKKDGSGSGSGSPPSRRKAVPQ
jgi:Ca-activated chloride channel family protein